MTRYSSNLTPSALLPQRWIVMGVSGCGKSEIGSRLARQLGIDFVEGDADHPASNIAKMAAGMPLDDDDRQAWLLILQARIRSAAQQGKGLVLSCSSLKRRYRDLLRSGDPQVRFIYLDGDRALIAARMQARPNHFMPPALLDSQFRDLQVPAPEEDAIRLDIRKDPDQLIDDILRQCTARAPHAPHNNQQGDGK